MTTKTKAFTCNILQSTQVPTQPVATVKYLEWIRMLVCFLCSWLSGKVSFCYFVLTWVFLSMILPPKRNLSGGLHVAITKFINHTEENTYILHVCKYKCICLYISCLNIWMCMNIIVNLLNPLPKGRFTMYFKLS